MRTRCGGAQVGYGDVVAQSNLGKLAVLAMICVGVVLIPVQTSALYAQLTARRVTLGICHATLRQSPCFDAPADAQSHANTHPW